MALKTETSPQWCVMESELNTNEKKKLRQKFYMDPRYSSAHFCISKVLERGNGTQQNISRLLTIYADDGKHKIISKQGEDKMLLHAT